MKKAKGTRFGLNSSNDDEFIEKYKVELDDYRFEDDTDASYKGLKAQNITTAVRKQWRLEAEAMVEKANQCHQQVGSLMRQSLQYAKKAGELLLGSKRRVPRKKGEWTSFLRKNFDDSLRTAYAYMRVAKKWNDPRIVAAKAGGMSPTSIQGFLDVISGKRVPEPSKMSVDEMKEAQELRLVKEFVKLLSRLDPTELRVLENNVDDLWDRLQRRLKDVVCMTLEFDYYHDREWMQRRYEAGNITKAERDLLKEEADEMKKSKRARSKSWRERAKAEETASEKPSRAEVIRGAEGIRGRGRNRD